MSERRRTDDELRAALDSAGGLDDFERRHGGDGAGGNAAEGTTPPRPCLTVAEWRAREAAEEDLLLGAVCSTSSIILLAAETGLGKTMVALGIAFSIALGRDFLHWRGGRKARVLLIDGEMPTDLMKERILAACRWFGVEGDVDRLYILSREDHPDMPPLNTEEGQRWLDARIAKLGGVDFIIFDNIMSLTVGDLRETDSWATTRPYVKALQRRRIGQLWLHHVGHDKGRSYGDKTREWDIDAVMIGERAEGDADVIMKVTFTKARRRRPDTAADFAPVTIELRGDRWSATAAPSGGARHKPAGLSPAGRLVVRALEKALAYVGERPPGHDETRGVDQAVTVEQLKIYFRQMAVEEDPDLKPSTRRSALKRGIEDALGKGAVRKWGDWIWKAT